MKCVITINSGSSSLKFQVLNLELEVIHRGLFERLGLANSVFVFDKDRLDVAEGLNHVQALQLLLSRLNEAGLDIQAVGHRVVHGGTKFKQPVLIDSDVYKDLELLTPLAPLHQPHNLAGIRAVSESMPDVPQIAVFDTMFHSSIPESNRRFPLPEKYWEEGVQAYGFHGLSYDFISRNELVKDSKRCVVAHLGNGSSLCAMQNGVSKATSMGFTAIDGLMMGTRTGSMDPGVILHLMNSGMSYKEISDLLYKQSGLLGVSGVSSDIRDIMREMDNGNKQAEMAFQMFVDRIAMQITRLATLIGGLDTLVFTAGIGENNVKVRQAVCDRLNWIGVVIAEDACITSGIGPDGVRKLSIPMLSKVEVCIIPTNEEWILGHYCKELLKL